MNASHEFMAAIQAAGLEPPEHIEPGRLYRFPGAGKRNSNTAAWCRLFEDGEGGVFGDWSTGLSATWRAKQDKPRSPAERAEFARQVKTARFAVDADRKERQALAAERAKRIWAEAKPAPKGFPYLENKRIRAYDARIHNSALVLPVGDFEGLTSLQFINGDGSKRLLPGGRKKACFIPVQRPQLPSRRVIVCEGWATGSTLAEDDPEATVLAAIDAGNLEAVAVAIRAHWPKSEIVIAGDDDRKTKSNPGRAAANKAAVAANALIAFPQFPEGAPADLSDFNDLAVYLASQQKGEAA